MRKGLILWTQTVPFIEPLSWWSSNKRSL